MILRHAFIPLDNARLAHLCGSLDEHLREIETALGVALSRRNESFRVEGAKGAAEILYRSELGDAKKIEARIEEYKNRFANPFVAAERGYIDEVIKPSTTRKRLCRALNMLRNKTLENPWKKHDNIPL